MSALERGRRMAASRMSETVQVFTVSLQETGGIRPVEVRTVHYDGPARVKFSSSVVSDAVAAGQLVATQSVELHLPSGSVVPVDASVEVTASSVDGSLVGRRFTVSGRPQAGQTTAARYPVKEGS